MKYLVCILGLFLIFVSCENKKYVPYDLCLGTKGFDEIYDVCVFANGSKAVCGVIEDDFVNDKGDTLRHSGSYDAFVALYDSNNVLVWMHVLGDLDWDEANSVAGDSEGNVYLSGHFKGCIFLENDTLFSKGNSDLFVIKLNQNGKIIKSCSIGTKGKDEASDLIITDGNIYLLGMLSGTIEDSLCNSQTIYKGNLDVGLIRLNKELKIEKVALWGGQGEDFAGSLMLAGDSVFLCGGFTDTLKIRETVLISKGERNAFYLSVDTALNYGMARAFPFEGDEFVNSIIKLNNEIIICGQSKNSTSDNYNAFVANSSRRFEWGGKFNDWAKGMLCIDNKKICLASVIQDTLTIKDTSIVSSGSYDILLIECNANLDINAMKSLGARGEDGINKIIMGPNKKAWACGWYSEVWKKDARINLKPVHGISDALVIPIEINP